MRLRQCEKIMVNYASLSDQYDGRTLARCKRRHLFMYLKACQLRKQGNESMLRALAIARFDDAGDQFEQYCERQQRQGRR